MIWNFYYTRFTEDSCLKYYAHFPAFDWKLDMYLFVYQTVLTTHMQIINCHNLDFSLIGAFCLNKYTLWYAANMYPEHAQTY